MAKVMVVLLVALLSLPAWAKPRGGSHGGTTHVRGHVTKSGTHVAPHTRTAANKTQRDNWSSKGKTNPMTGKAGTKAPTK